MIQVVPTSDGIQPMEPTYDKGVPMATYSTAGTIHPGEGLP